MNESQDKQPAESAESAQGNEQRRDHLRSLGKWSGASVLAAVVGTTAWISSAGSARAGWVNRSGGGRGGWLNGGGGWVNRRGGGGWLNRR